MLQASWSGPFSGVPPQPRPPGRPLPLGAPLKPAVVGAPPWRSSPPATPRRVTSAMGTSSAGRDLADRGVLAGKTPLRVLSRALGQRGQSTSASNRRRPLGGFATRSASGGEDVKTPSTNWPADPACATGTTEVSRRSIRSKCHGHRRGHRAPQQPDIHRGHRGRQLPSRPS